jgi:carbamoylphosphate synthase small subunit
MRIEISRSDIIKALRSEPISNFSFGSWAYDKDGSNGRLGESCQVCAVGSIIRSSVAANSQIGTIYKIADRITQNGSITVTGIDRAYAISKELMDLGLVMNAISVLYESLCSQSWNKRLGKNLESDMEEIIEEVITFVRENAPESFVHSVDGIDREEIRNSAWQLDQSIED